MKKNLKKSFILLFFWFGVFIQLLAQGLEKKNFSVNWTDNQKIELTSGKYIQMPVCDVSSVDFERKLPLFFSKWQVPFNSQIQSYQLKNEIYEDIASSKLLDINPENIPTNLEIQINTLTTRQQSDVYLQIMPLVKDGNRVKRLISFDIEYTLTVESVKKSTKIAANNSVLASGKWYKIAVDTTGVYKIDKSFLSDLGISTNNIDPRNIQIYGNGGALLPYRIGNSRYDDLMENAIYVSGEEDGKFDSQDYILFYAKGPESWKHSNTLSSLIHVKNIYSDKAYYFIHIGSEQGKRITDGTAITGSPVVVYQNFDDYWVHEKDALNLFNAGQQWLGESFYVNNQQTLSYVFTNLDTSSPVTIKTRVVGAASNSTSFQVKLNSQSTNVLNLSPTSDYTLATSYIGSANVSVSDEHLTIDLTYNNNGNAAAKAYLDYIEIIGKKHLIAGNKQFSFRNFSSFNQSGIVGYQIQNPANVFKVWDVSDYINPKNVANTSSSNTYFEFSVQGGQIGEYVLLNSDDFYKPTRPSDYVVQNQNLHNLSDVDYLIITKENFTDQAETLAQYHRSQGLNVTVIPLYQIYNEFGSGSPDITAIRDFVRQVYLNSNLQLKYLLLYGDASFDFKGIKEDEGVVPAFESYNSFDMTSSFVTDDFYGIVSDTTEGDLDASAALQSMDVAVARIPFNTVQEAQKINEKLLKYYQSASMGDWRNNILMVADDTDKSGDETLQISQESLSDVVHANKPMVNVKKIWIDAYNQEVSAGGSRYPTVNTAINNAVESGILLFDYFGHGGEDGLTAERIVETSQISDWYNPNNLNVMSVISCEFARFDNPARPNTAGELIIRNEEGASAHLIATAREIYIHVGQYFNQNLMDKLLEYNGISNTISENLRLVKNTYTDSQRFFIFSFGDPAMKLALPKPNVKLTQMNGVDVTQSLDTIKALSRVSFDGVVTLSNGQTDTNFNGEVYLSVFDKPQDKQTLNNDGLSSIMTFDTQDSKLFRGRASVTNGQFHIEFVAPQDIRVAYGYGKLSFYAQNGTSDRGGYNTDIVIGGINYNAETDNIGPDIKLYMNNTSFIDGGNTNQSPLFLAYLEDENGINTSFSSVDHDISAVLDDDQQNPIILNEYYVTDVDDFTKGNLEYRLRDLTVGLHTITLKAYDTYNNPSEATLNFVVVDDAKLILEHVLNYPNPFVNYTEFWFSHNKPNETLDVQIQIFTVSGKLVKTINQTVQDAGTLSRDITWDGLDDFGQKIGKGVYVFKLKVKTENNLKAEKFEKLVILQ